MPRINSCSVQGGIVSVSAEHMVALLPTQGPLSKVGGGGVGHLQEGMCSCCLKTMEGSGTPCLSSCCRGPLLLPISGVGAT